MFRKTEAKKKLTWTLKHTKFMIFVTFAVYINTFYPFCQFFFISLQILLTSTSHYLQKQKTSISVRKQKEIWEEKWKKMCTDRMPIQFKPISCNIWPELIECDERFMDSIPKKNLFFSVIIIDLHCCCWLMLCFGSVHFPIHINQYRVPFNRSTTSAFTLNEIIIY